MDQLSLIFSCTYHENEPITGYCLNELCQYNRKCCTQCVLFKHLDHKEDFKTLSMILKLIEEQYQLLTEQNQNLSNKFMKINNLHQITIQFLEREKTKLIELENLLQNRNPSVDYRDLLMLRTWNFIIQTRGKNIDGKTLRSLLKKLDKISKTVLSEVMPQQNIQFPIIIQFVQPDWGKYSQILNNLIKERPTKFDYHQIYQITKDQQKMIHEWKLTSLNAFKLSEQIYDRVKQFLTMQSSQISELKSNLNNQQYQALQFNEYKLIRVRESKRYQEAVKVSDQLINLQPHNHLNFILKGQTLEEMGNFSGAIDCFNKAIQHCDNSYVQKHKKQALLKSGRNEEAQQVQQRIDELKKKKR